jgi:hypothetical protein
MIVTAFLGYADSLYRCNISLYSHESTLCLTLPTIIGNSGTGDKMTKNNCDLTPVVVYENADIQKKQIYLENNQKSGFIYEGI